MADPVPSSGSDDVCTCDPPTVFWLGAGFSRCVTKGKLPLMFDFFKELNASTHPELHRFLCDAFGTPNEANVEHALALLDLFDSCPTTGPVLDILFNRQDPRKVRSQLGTYCFNRLHGANWDASHWAVDFLAHAGRCDTVVTVNYDTLAESILSHKCDATHRGMDPECFHCRMCAMLEGRVLSQTRAKPTEEWQQIVLKLHGSRAWQICRDPTCPFCDKIIPDRHCRPLTTRACSSCKSDTEPVMVLPSMQKSFHEYPGISRMWNAAITALTRAEQIVIFGFSFPESDLLIKHAFKRALHQNKSLDMITIVDVAPVAVCQRVSALMPRDRIVDFRLLEVPQDHSDPEWMERAA